MGQSTSAAVEPHEGANGDASMAAATIPGPDDPYSKRPPTHPFLQQELRSWNPLMTGKKLIIVEIIFALFFIPFGVVMVYDSRDDFHMMYKYDGDNSDGDQCKITEDDEGRECQISFNITKHVEGPVYVYYEVDDFYQNHERYVTCYSQDQLQGDVSGDISDCAPLKYNGSLTLHPCGLIANTYFNDVITVASGNYNMTETGISWSSDDHKYSQPDGFTYAVCEEPGNCTSCLGSSYDDACKFYEEDGVRYAFYYPDDDSYQYLYESYPQISPLLGVEDEHFMVWMRVAGLSVFRKLYGIIESDLEAGDVLIFNVTANFMVGGFDGSKRLFIANTDYHGPKNDYLGISYVVTGCFSLLCAMVISVRAFFFPRQMGNISYLI